MIPAHQLATRAPWQTGVAKVVTTKGPTAIVECPHCGHNHQHPRNFIGSRHVIAGCHTGFSKCREYTLVQVRPQRSGSQR